MDKKPEHMTSLRGKQLVSKTHGRIAFRGVIDILEAEVIEAQVLALSEGAGEICAYLGEVLDFLRSLMAAEVKETPVSPPFLFGMNAGEIHDRIEEMDWKAMSVPSFTHGPVPARINTIRAKVREAELLSVKVFGPLDSGKAEQFYQERQDIILALNRLSGALWWLFTQAAIGRREGQSKL